ncbi:MAG: hypothetical protein ABH863_05280 [Candidatus Micrarchaeota archaeon]
MRFDLDLMKALFPPRKKPVHTMKWGFPEARYTAAVEDVEKKIPAIKGKAKFAGGGEYLEEIHAKDYGNGVFAYFIVRIDKKTEAETVYSEAYMLREEDKLGIDAMDAFKVSQDFEKLGYRHLFDREIMVWSFRRLLKVVNAFDIADFGNFVEVGLPATKIASARETDEKWKDGFFLKLGMKKEDAVPTDAITLQLVTMMDKEQQQEFAEKQNSGMAGEGSQGGEPSTHAPAQQKKSMGFGKGKGNLF